MTTDSIPQYKCPVCGSCMGIPHLRTSNKVNYYYYECDNRVISKITGGRYSESWIETSISFEMERAEITFMVNDRLVALCSDYLDDKNTLVWLEKSDSKLYTYTPDFSFEKLAALSLIPFEQMTPNLISEHRLRTMITFS